MKLGKFNVISQGLALPISVFDVNIPNEENIDVTEMLGVTYAVEEDNARKNGDPNAKYKAMAARKPHIFKKPWARWMMKRNWGRKIMFFFFGKKKDNPRGFPVHIASKTDVERIQNEIWRLADKRLYVATEKIDGTSFTAAAERTKMGKVKYYICSRNVVFTADKTDCFYDSNVYIEAFEKYNLREILNQMLNKYNLSNIAIQAEVFGKGIQKRDYSMSEHEMRVFHIVSNNVKFSMDKVVEMCDDFDLPHVPILNWEFIMPDTIEELTKYVEETPSMLDGLEREGIVFYDKETGREYVKFVSPNYLMKYHG